MSALSVFAEKPSAQGPFNCSNPKPAVSIAGECPAAESAAPSDEADCGAETEGNLITFAQAGSATAFSELVRRYHRQCMQRACRILRNYSNAEDEVQNAYLKAFESIGQFRGDGKFGAWLSRIVENQCLMTFRVPRRTFHGLSEPSETHSCLELVCQDINPEDSVGREEVIAVLRREVKRLPPIMRDMVLLCDLNEQPLSEVAAQLSISVPAAKSRLARARCELRSRLSKHIGRRGPSLLMMRAAYSETAYGSSSATFSSAA